MSHGEGGQKNRKECHIYFECDLNKGETGRPGVVVSERRSARNFEQIKQTVSDKYGLYQKRSLQGIISSGVWEVFFQFNIILII